MANVITNQPITPPPSYTEAVSGAENPPPYSNAYSDKVITNQPSAESTNFILDENVPNFEENPEEQEQRRRRRDDCCADCDFDEDDGYCIYLICRVFCKPCGACLQSIGQCTDDCCESCASCLHSCCEPSQTGDNGCCNGCCEGDGGCCEGDGGCCEGDDGCCEGDGGCCDDCDCDCSD